MKKFLFILFCIILSACSPKLIYTADVNLMYDNQVIKSWDSVKIVDSAEDYVGFVTNNQMKFVIGDILITNQRDSIYIK